MTRIEALVRRQSCSDSFFPHIQSFSFVLIRAIRGEEDRTSALLGNRKKRPVAAFGPAVAHDLAEVVDRLCIGQVGKQRAVVQELVQQDHGPAGTGPHDGSIASPDPCLFGSPDNCAFVTDVVGSTRDVELGTARVARAASRRSIAVTRSLPGGGPATARHCGPHGWQL